MLTLTPFDEKNNILLDRALQQETGFRRFENGDYLVSMTCPMPGVTPEMIAWWFWWHPQKSERYRMWFPGEHFFVGYAKKDRAYFSAPACPPFAPNTQYPIEKIGALALPLEIDFMTPESFGFDPAVMADNDIPIIVCGHVSAMYGLVPHTEMAHIFRRTDDGLFLISRFWIGKRLKNPLLRKAVLTDKTAEGMATHCFQEYRNLAKLLPPLFAKENCL